MSPGTQFVGQVAAAAVAGWALGKLLVELLQVAAAVAWRRLRGRLAAAPSGVGVTAPARARLALTQAWEVVCLFVVEECQPPDALRRIWSAVMWLFLGIAAWLLFVLGLLVLAGALAATVRVP
jgi:hypothetical protein